MAEDRVRRRRVEEEIRQRKLQEIIDAGECSRLAPKLPDDLPHLRAIDLCGVQRAKIVDRVVDERGEFGEALLTLAGCWGFPAGEARAGAATEIACELDLAGKRKHVRIQARIEENRFVDLLGLRVRC